jgi:hypothetical protein
MGAPACSDASENCRGRHTRTLKSNAQVRVYGERSRCGERSATPWIATWTNQLDVRHNVFKSDASRHAVLLDYGTRIVPDSLKTRTAVFAR